MESSVNWKICVDEVLFYSFHVKNFHESPTKRYYVYQPLTDFN